MIPAEADAMDAGIQMQGINVGKKRVEKIGSEAWSLLFLEPASFFQIPLGFVEDPNRHEDEDGLDSRFFATSQSVNTA